MKAPSSSPRTSRCSRARNSLRRAPVSESAESVMASGSTMEALWQTNESGSPEKASLARKQRRVWRYPYPSVASSSALWTKPLRRTRIGGSLLDPLKKSVEHPPLVFSVVVTEYVLVQVRLKVLGGDAPVYAAHATLHVGPEPVDGVRVDIATHVDLVGVGNPIVLVAHVLEVVPVDRRL